MSGRTSGAGRRLAAGAILAAAATVLFVIEAQIPPVVPIPGVKLGLANAVTVCAMFICGPLDTLAILAVRIVLGNLFTGQLVSLCYSAAGGLACYLCMLALYRLLTDRQIWVCGAFGAVAHSVGQMLCAAAFMKTWAVFAYLPASALASLIAGVFTGLCAQFAAGRLNKITNIRRTAEQRRDHE